MNVRRPVVGRMYEALGKLETFLHKNDSNKVLMMPEEARDPALRKSIADSVP